jgi:hypothetical protein
MNFSSNFFINISFILVPVMFGFLSILRGQDMNWDLLNYHLYNPYAFLGERLQKDVHPAGIQSYFNPVLDLIFYYLYFFSKPKLVGFMVGFIQGINFIFLYKILEKVLSSYKFSQILIIVTSVMSIFSSVFLSELGTSLNDSVTSIFVLGSLNLLMGLNGPEKNKKKLLILAGILIGIGSGLKLTNIIYAIPLSISLLFTNDTLEIKFKYFFIFCFFSLVGFLLIDGFWMMKLYSQFKNPFYPLYNNIFKSEYFSTSIAFMDERFLPRSVLEFLFYPFYFTFNPNLVSELAFGSISWFILYVLFIISLIKHLFFSRKLNLNRATLIFSIFFFFSYCLWLILFGIFRYLCVLDLLTPALIIILLHFIFSKYFFRFFSTFLLVAILLVNITYFIDWGHASWAAKLFSYNDEKGQLMNNSIRSTIFMADQPSAFVIPIINKSEFNYIQISNSSFLSDKPYKLNEHSFILFNSEGDKSEHKYAFTRLKELKLKFNNEDCNNLYIFVGTKKFNYKYCKLSINNKAAN